MSPSSAAAAREALAATHRTMSSSPPRRPPGGPRVDVSPAGEPDWHEFTLGSGERRVLFRVKVEPLVVTANEEVTAAFAKVSVVGPLAAIADLLRHEGYHVNDAALRAARALDPSMPPNVLLVDEAEPGKFTTGDALNYLFAALARRDELAAALPASPRRALEPGALGEMFVDRVLGLHCELYRHPAVRAEVLDALVVPYFRDQLRPPAGGGAGEPRDHATLAAHHAGWLLCEAAQRYVLFRNADEYVRIFREAAGFLSLYLPAIDEHVGRGTQGG
jgi:hypothetical protein